MRAATGWFDYELIDAGSKERLERWGQYYLVRPDPQAIWETERTHPKWESADAVYHRSSTGGGSWEYRKKLPEEWTISWNNRLNLYVTPTAFNTPASSPSKPRTGRFTRSSLKARKGL